MLGIFLDEKIEWIDDRHAGGEIDLDAEFAGRLRKYEPRQPVAVRVLLPIDKMAFRQDFQRVARNARAAMRRRPQPDDLRPDGHGAVVAVVGDMVQGRKDRHNFSAAGEGPTKATDMPLGKP